MSVISKKRAIATVAGLVGVAIVVAGCTDAPTGQPGENAGGPSVEFGADAATWQAAFDEAFADRDDIEIVWNSSSAATTPSGAGVQTIADKIEEYSNGHVSVVVSFSDSVAPITETFLALQDGRLDVSNVGTFLRPEEFPIMGTIGHEAVVTRGPSPVADSLSSYAAFIETFWDTPEMIAEYQDKGLQVLNPESVSGQNVLACREPWTSLDELQGKRIRLASQLQAKQAEAIGGVPVTVAYPDLYEAVQRGIVDCLIIGLGSIDAFEGMAQLAPHMINTQSSAFGINTNSYMASAERWSSWPLVLQQLIFDLQAEDNVFQHTTIPTVSKSVLDDVQSVGGGFYELEQDVEEALSAAADEIIEAWSDFPPLDGDDFRERLLANMEKWEALVEEAGYTDAPFSETDEWLETELDPSAFGELYYEEIIIPHRPS